MSVRLNRADEPEDVLWVVLETVRQAAEQLVSELYKTNPFSFVAAVTAADNCTAEILVRAVGRRDNVWAISPLAMIRRHPSARVREAIIDALCKVKHRKASLVLLDFFLTD